MAMTIRPTKKSSKRSLTGILVICAKLLVVASLWMSVEQVADLRPPPLQSLHGSAHHQQQQQQPHDNASSSLPLEEETQRLLDAPGALLIKANHTTQTQMAAAETASIPQRQHTIGDSSTTVAVNKVMISSSLAATDTTINKKTSALSNERSPENETNRHDGDHALLAFGPVQAWSESDEAEVVRRRRLPNRTIYTNIASIPPYNNNNNNIPFDNTTINPALPSMKVNSATMLNMEIPLNYSITADMTSTVPWSNVSTLAFYQGRFYSGFRNQIMAFTVLVMEAKRAGHGQVLLRSLRMKDTYGTDQLMEFAKLWDVTHWNSHYPQLPRLVDYDPILHSQFNFQDSRWYRTSSATTEKDENWYGAHGLFATQLPMRPHASWPQPRLFTAYMRYALKGRGPFVPKTAKTIDPRTGKMVGFRNPVEILMLQGAMRPHPNFQAIINRLLAQSGLEKGSVVVGNEYMTLHARVEPDMQRHPVCRDKKVVNLTAIFDFMEQKWPNEPPVSRIFMPINRQYMELEGHVNKNEPNQTNWMAVHNLEALNHARDYGLWGGRVKVLEFGANALDNTTYADRPSTGGAMLNFFLGIDAKIFIGTEVSSYSHDILATRFFRNAIENYKYLPDGLHDWTPPGTVDPPGFGC